MTHGWYSRVTRRMQALRRAMAMLAVIGERHVRPQGLQQAPRQPSQQPP